MLAQVGLKSQKTVTQKLMQDYCKGFSIWGGSRSKVGMERGVVNSAVVETVTVLYSEKESKYWMYIQYIPEMLFSMLHSAAYL